MRNKRDRISDNPRKLPFELIKLITNNFSEELGRGAFGRVFKGVLEDGEEVAVKMLPFMPNIHEQHFENEFEILKGLEHPNIVRLLGFCDEAKEEFAEYNGKLIICQRIHRALCLEYMPKGCLGKLLSGENLGKNWPIRYKIIKGICEGLKYLQNELEFPIYHFDLKPENILLNENMIPKISDFGLSRLIGEENTKKTLSPLGTIGYMPPEFIKYQIISKEYDIYSLGVIMTKIIITGTAGYSDVADMGAEEFVKHVHERWKKCLQEIPKYESLEVDCKQVKICIEIARKCMENDRRKRPRIKDIVSQLDEMEKGLQQTTAREARAPPTTPPSATVVAGGDHDEPARAERRRVQSQEETAHTVSVAASVDSESPRPGGDEGAGAVVDDDGDVSIDSLWASMLQRRVARTVVVHKSESWGNEELPRLQRVAETAAAARRHLRKSVSAFSKATAASRQTAFSKATAASRQTGWRTQDVLVGISPDELLRRAESFIRRQREHLRRQRLQSERVFQCCRMEAGY